jgi:diguanylate cyclase (GGDEF)-like protein/PAS domain S-box-containing protein
MGALLLALAMLVPSASNALEAVVISPDQKRLDMTLLGELYEGRGDTLSVETAPGADGITGRMSVQATTPGTDPNWVVFALTNPTDQRIERILSARRFEFAGSKIVWPDLDAPRIARVTPSVGFRPDPLPADQGDLFRLSLEPGATVTFIVELRSIGFPRLLLWEPAALSKRAIDFTLLNGILLGIAGLLAIVLTAIFVANHRAIFPVTALVAWAVVAYLCVDFGFWHKLFQLQADQNAVYRAAAEAGVAASIVIFLFVYLRLRQWHSWLVPLFAGWALMQIGLIAFAVIDARLTSGLARLSFVPIAGIGSLLILIQSLRGDDRALTLLPTWMLFLVWLFGAAMSVLGYLSGDIVVGALSSGLVLFIALLGFSVTQYAFHPGEHSAAGDGSSGLSALALESSGAAIWEWDVRRDEIKVGAAVEEALGYSPGTLRCSKDDWLQYLHAGDMERAKLLLGNLREREGGELALDFRLRRADGTYIWYELRGRGMRLRQSQILQCTGVMRDVTAQKRSEERLKFNAVYDTLTGLANRELFMDRVNQAITRSAEDGTKPTVLMIDVDRLRGAGQTPDMLISDSMLLTVARRLSRHVRPLDTLARVGVDQFAMLLTSETEPRYIAMLAERVRRSLRSPMKLSGREMVLIGSIGIAVHDKSHPDRTALVQEAELAMYRAKRAGADRIELFKPDMRSGRDDRLEIAKELRQAIDRRQIQVLYQPILRLADNRLSGVEALIRWDHPKLGALSPPDFMSVADKSEMINHLTIYVAERAIRQLSRWHKALPREEDPLYLSLDMSSEMIYRAELVQEMCTLLGRGTVPAGCFWIEINEAVVMENPETMVEALASLKNAGAKIALDEFGSGYSSLPYLQRLPFSMIKTDRAMMRSAGAAGGDPVILRSILAMARELDLDVTAQGIDRERDAAYLRALGCDYGQGFYFGEPLGERDMMALVQTLARTEDKGKSAPRKARESNAKRGLPASDSPPQSDGIQARRPRADAAGAVDRSHSEIRPGPVHAGNGATDTLTDTDLDRIRQRAPRARTSERVTDNPLPPLGEEFIGNQAENPRSESLLRRASAPVPPRRRRDR